MYWNNVISNAMSNVNVLNCYGAIQVLRTAFFKKLDRHPSYRNANNVEDECNQLAL